MRFIAVVAVAGAHVSYHPGETEVDALRNAILLYGETSGISVDLFEKIGPRPATVRWPANADNTAIGTPNPGPAPDLLAGIMYAAYSESVGGVSVRGDQLPSWDKLIASPCNAKVVNAWIAAAQAAIYAISTPGSPSPSPA